MLSFPFLWSLKYLLSLSSLLQFGLLAFSFLECESTKMYFVLGGFALYNNFLFYLFWENLAFAFACGCVVLLVHSYLVVD